MSAINLEARFVPPNIQGHLRLLPSIVLANRPQKLFPSLRSALVRAFGTSAYALVTPTTWPCPMQRATGGSLIMAATMAVIVWIIIAHKLWERRDDFKSRKRAVLYNDVTAQIVRVEVVVSYIVLCPLVLLGAGVFVPGGYFQSILQHPVDFGDYVTSARIVTSLARVASALGSSLEDADTVREAAYGYRQQQYQEQAEQPASDQLKA